MTASESLKLPSLLPPTKKSLVIKDRLSLVLELLWFLFIFVPCRLLLSLYRKVFPPPGKSLKGQVVIVTGAGRGLGRGLAMRFAEEGAVVAVVDIDRHSAALTAQTIVDAGGIAKPYFTNVGRVEDIHQLQLSIVKDLGPVDILVNNAGLIHIESIGKMTQAEVRSVIDINLLSHFWMAQEFLPQMKSRNSGHIVAICSMSAVIGLGHGSAYAASKWGLSGFMESLRAELNLNPINNIKTTTVLPYFINTSEHYVKQWDTRLPPLSIEEVVEATVTSVKREEVVLSVPRTSYYTSFLKLLPTDIHDKFMYSIVYTRLIPPTKEAKDKDRTQHLISEHSKKRQELKLN